MTILNCNIPTPNAIREQVELHALAKQENLQERIAAAQSEKAQKMFSVAKDYLEKVTSGHIVSFPVLALEVGTDSHLRQVMFEVAQAFVAMGYLCYYTKNTSPRQTGEYTFHIQWGA